jgi:hypothetical protein
MESIDLTNMSEVDIYHNFVESGMELDALNGSYPELVELIGCEATLKLFKYFRGSKIDCPKFFYKQDFIAEIAAKVTDKRERAKIAIASGYTSSRIEVLISANYKKNHEQVAELTATKVQKKAEKKAQKV